MITVSKKPYTVVDTIRNRGFGSKLRLVTLSESLQHFDQEERNEAISILQGCIQDLESNNSAVCSSSADSNEQADCGYQESLTDSSQFESTENLSLNDHCQELNSSDDKDNCDAPECNSQSEEEEEEEEEVVVGEGEKVEEGILDVESLSEEESVSSWKCPKCEEEYDDKSYFIEHLQSHPGKPKSCKSCLKEFSNSISFKFHKQLEICLKPSKAFKCNLCNKKLFGESQYNIHVNAHKRNQCKKCGDHFSRRKHLIAHELNVHNISQDKELFRCDICGRTFIQKRSLVHHHKITHPDKNPICSICLEMLDSEAELQAHLVTHNLQSFTCEKCGENFTRRQQYLVHLQEHDKYKCSTCEESFSSKKVAMSHARKGHSVSGLEDQLQCLECGRLFCNKALLSSHMVEHTGNALACEKCKVTFKTYNNYLNHLETREHLQGEELKTVHICKECNKTFSSHNSLRVHTSLVHRANLKEHTCTHCSYKTKFAKNLRRHIALHTEKPQFICDVCGSQFHTKNSLQEHTLRIHSVWNNFSCEKCGKAFKRSSDLNRHLTNTHSDAPLYACHCGNKYKSMSSLHRHQLTNHDKVEIKQMRLKKLFPVEKRPQKKKITPDEKDQSADSKKAKKNVNKSLIKKEKKLSKFDSAGVIEILSPLVESQVPLVSPLTESNTIIMEDNLDQALLEVTYSMDFDGVDKSQAVYSHDLDLNSFQVESVIQLDNEPIIESAGVLINVRNLFNQALTNEFIPTPPLEPSIMVELEESLNASQQLDVTSHKEDIISSLQEYILPQELNFFNV